MENLTKNFAEVELVYKSKVKPADRVKVLSAKDTVKVFRAVYDINKIEHKEMFYAMYLNRNNHVLGVILISEGGINSTVCDVRLILQGALKLNASGVIVSHNHPSGNLTASQQDKDLTTRIVDACKLMDMQVLDHVILTIDGYYSFSEEGQI